MTKKIFRSAFLTAVAAMVLVGILIIGVLYGFFNDRIGQELDREAQYLAAALNARTDHPAYLSTLTLQDSRVTLVQADGVVLYDSNIQASAMENHLERPEIAGALRSGQGKSTRFSATLAELTHYVAVRLDNGDILRISSTQSTVFGLLLRMVTPFVLILIVVAVGSALLARRLSRKITAPINHLDLENPLSNDIYDELSPLLLRLSRQKEQIALQMDELATRQREFAAVTENMREGLLVLDAEENILSINPSASAVFGMPPSDCLGKYILALNRSLPLQRVLEQARDGRNAQELFEHNGKTYQILANPVSLKHRGTVILILDVTEKQNAEQLRREFSANVSHELKTPLTSISGYAEIMAGGLVPPEDMPGFARRIYDEATRLVHLIDDILRLSQLDEQQFPSTRERVDLLALAHEVCARLKNSAAQRGVCMRVQGVPTYVTGVRQILDEMIFNLCDNAIKYNHLNGRVDITVENTPNGPALTVRDTGMGIPIESHGKIFERFYRVDKSHSKETGGTGLGLSIVKHGALFHQAKIELQSEPGKGTTICLHFPRETGV